MFDAQSIAPEGSFAPFDTQAQDDSEEGPSDDGRSPSSYRLTFFRASLIRVRPSGYATAMANPEQRDDGLDEGRGDNPGVGGVPADGEIEHDSEGEDLEDDEENRGDNPGVGGIPNRDEDRR